MIEHHINGTSALHHITTDVTDQAHIAVGIHIDLQIHHVAQLLMVQRHDALQDDNRLRLNMNRFWQTIRKHIGIGGLFHSLAIPEFLDLLSQQFPVKGVRMVEVNLLPLLWRQVGGVVVIRV